jgi:LasA protease
MFGYPFDWAIEPLMPETLSQPNFILPFEPGQSWSYTGGPHGGWDSGSAWAAIDFAPPGEPIGCGQTEAWVTAVADGKIVRSENGAVVQDLDGDGLEQTGWTILYMHIESRERVGWDNLCAPASASDIHPAKADSPTPTTCTSPAATTDCGSPPTHPA